ncbi:SLAC1 anion channel family protein [Aeromonas veronii]|uniref:SLAC1 anion channel family protein n=1 Tax=Aeromonas veronii TaxID=654 RepID=UPI001A8C997E|nr:SLAC1 anion channel family protein [Aeromonas veronii]MBO0397974.1 SLAC1 anion channel family protein [Aeromonas veronii]
MENLNQEGKQIPSITKIAHMHVTLFSIIMGLTGAAIACRKAFPDLLLLQSAGFLFGVLSSLLLATFLVMYGWKILRHNDEFRHELKHPVRINFFPTISISLLLQSAYWASWHDAALALWSVGASLQLLFTLYIMSNWIHRDHFTITHTNPAWFIPIVGNIVVPLGGVPLGFHEISLFFFSIGLIFWFSLLTIVLYRLFFHESLPEKLMPTMFILLAPPSIGFISYSEIASSSDLFAHVIYYFALFVFILLMYNTLTFLKLKFFLSSWAYSFPLAAFSAASAMFADATGNIIPYYLAKIVVCALIVLIIWLISMTVQSFYKGEIFTPEK